MRAGGDANQQVARFRIKRQLPGDSMQLLVDLFKIPSISPVNLNGNDLGFG